MDNVLSLNSIGTKQNSHLPILDRITPDDLFGLGTNTEKLSKLENTCFDNGVSQKAYEELLYVFNNFKTLDLAEYHQKVKMGIDTANFDVNSVNFINALSYYLYAKTRGKSPEIVFFSYFNTKDNDGKLKHNYTFDCRRFALFVFTEFYEDILMLSTKGKGSSSPYYFYQEENCRWITTGDKLLKHEMNKQISTLMDLLGFRTEATKHAKKITNDVISLINTIEDEEQNAMISWTLKNPNLVQFKDTVYDIENHTIAKMSPKFMLYNYHDYRLPIESVDLDKLTEEDGFVPLKETMAEMEEKSKLVLERLSLLTKEKEFMTTVIGNGFCHNDDFTVFPILEGDTAIGKSWFFGMLTEYLYGERNASHVNHDNIRRSNKRYTVSTFGKEFNLMADISGSVMNQKFVDFITLDTNRGYDRQCNLNSYIQILGLVTNSGQMPVIPKRNVNNKEIRKRIVHIKCRELLEEGRLSIRVEKFTKEALSEKMPYFALFSMMKLQQHKDNGNVLKFMYEVDGCSKYPIEGFTSQDMVDSTVSYFKQQKRV